MIVHSHAVDDAMIHLCAREGIECIIRIEPRKSGIVRSYPPMTCATHRMEKSAGTTAASEATERIFECTGG